MSTDGKLAAPSVPSATELAHERLEQLFRNLGARVPAEIQSELFRGMDAILGEILNHHVVSKVDGDDFMLTSEAAKLLFVSRPHIATLLDQGKLMLHHKTGENHFVTKASVLRYQADRQAAVNAYQASTGNEE